MHFVDGRDQRLIAQWLGLTLQTVRQCVVRALIRQPQLGKLRTKTRRPKIVHMSQIQNPRDIEHGPFNARRTLTQVQNPK
jgi:hypothetical protein